MKSRVILIAVCALMMAGVSAAQVPANDDCLNAEWVPAPGMIPPLNTTNATYEGTEPMSACASAGDGVWYYFTPAIGGQTYINTCGSDYTAAIDLYWQDPMGAACDSAYMWPETNGCNAGNPVYCGGTGSAVTVTVTAGSTYYLHVFNPGSVTTMTASALRTGGNLNLNLGGAVPAELIKVGVD